MKTQGIIFYTQFKHCDQLSMFLNRLKYFNIIIKCVGQT